MSECLKCGLAFKDDLAALAEAELVSLMKAAERDGLTVAVESCRCQDREAAP